MKRFAAAINRAVVVCLGIVFTLSIFGQAKGDNGSVEQTLMQMERDWAQAGIKKDAAALERILGDEWTGIGFNGDISTKAQAIADLKSGQAAASTITLGEMKVKVYGNTAVVQGSDTEKSTYKGKDSSGKYLWMDVFVNRNGRWQAVASESTKVGK